MENIKIRFAKGSDAKDFCKLQVKLAQDSHFMLLTKAEAKKQSIKNQIDIFEKMSAHALPGKVLLAFIDDQLAGFLGYKTSHLSRVKHIVSSIAVGVDSKYQKQGVAKALFKSAEKQWKDMHIKRIELSVNTKNEPAINLYKTIGHKIEGIKKDTTCIDDIFYDEYLMSKIIP